MADYYRDHYVKAPAVRTAGELVDLRSDERVSVVVIPERFPSGALTPCSYIRLLQPLDHPAIGGDFDIVLADAQRGAALPCRHHRHATLRGGGSGCRRYV